MTSDAPAVPPALRGELCMLHVRQTAAARRHLLLARQVLAGVAADLYDRDAERIAVLRTLVHLDEAIDGLTALHDEQCWLLAGDSEHIEIGEAGE